EIMIQGSSAHINSSDDLNASQPLNHEESNHQSFNVIEENQGNETQISDSSIQKQSAEIMIQESAAQSSSFYIEEDSTNNKSSSLDDSDAAQPLSYEKECDNSQSDEYYDSTEEANEQRFNEIILRLMKSYSNDKYKSQINKQFKASKKKIKKVDKTNNKPVNNFIEKVSSNLTEEDSLPSVNEILKPSVTQSSHPSKETNLLDVLMDYQ
ncbi:35206_t:CDS:2, partial [Racocetra persica]